MSAPVNAPSSPETDERPDGRRLRSEGSRRRIIAALLELVAAGDLEPSAEAVADRAQVGLRSVFRHFKDMEGLRQEIGEEIETRLRATAAAPLAGENWRERLFSLIDRRADLFDQIMPYRRAGTMHRHRSEVLQQQNDMLVRTLRGVLTGVLPDNLDPDLVEALDLVMSVDSWIRLRLDQRLSADRARQVVRSTVAALIR